MRSLVQIELKKFAILPYIWGSGAVCLVALAFGGMFMAIGHFQGGFGGEISRTSGQASKLSSIDFCLLMVMVFLLVGFSVLGAALSGSLILKPYSGRALMLTLSYPINRSRLLLAKLVAVVVTTIALFLPTAVFTLAVVVLFNHALGALQEGSVAHTLARALLLILLAVLGLMGIVGIAVAIGFHWRSVPVMVGALIVLDALIGNAFSASLLVAAIVLGSIFLLALPVLAVLARAISHIQVP
ncbi:hypothetical protein KIM372_04740 [Bombiscardovia nodaiensis]|uniref:ABC transporter permease n=1 Tax=Bombiscardovia nodaiensis TaxID=2932181 RepID=A0ABM8B6U1_9BIFI|nr:hypothetical protein KIM372_04740 [Bombiscardovia nodaiensis]